MGPLGKDPALIERLRSVFPKQGAPFGFDCHAPLDDGRTQEVLRFLEEAGLRAWDSTKGILPDDKTEFRMSLEREYNAADLSACDYLEIWPPGNAVHMDAESNTGSGEMIIPQRRMPRGFAIMASFASHRYFVPEQAKATLERAGLRNVVFRAVSYRTSKDRPDDSEETLVARHGRPYWELDSDFSMPPLSPSMILTDTRGKPLQPGDFSRGLIPRDGLFWHAELHYRRSDLDALDGFDLARTREPFGTYNSRPFWRLVASRRFYETCVANKLKTGWVPIRVDPD
jgi:hypothetical protein